MYRVPFWPKFGGELSPPSPWYAPLILAANVCGEFFCKISCRMPSASPCLSSSGPRSHMRASSTLNHYVNELKKKTIKGKTHCRPKLVWPTIFKIRRSWFHVRQSYFQFEIYGINVARLTRCYFIRTLWSCTRPSFCMIWSDEDPGEQLKLSTHLWYISFPFTYRSNSQCLRISTH